ALADVIVFPALRPHFARPVIEAALMKKPVVVTDWPVLKEIIIPNKTGLLAHPDSAQDLVDKIKTLLLDRLLAQRMGKAGYEFAAQHFTPEHQIPKLLEMYAYLAPEWSSSTS